MRRCGASLTALPDQSPLRAGSGYVALVARLAPADRELRELRELISWCRARESRIGYFAALYTHVGEALERALAQDVFEHPDELRRLNDAFFERYRAAVDAYRAGRPASAVWDVAFRAAHSHRPCVLQHLMLGMNAHINFDLAVAVADSIDPADLPAFRPDFDRMNALLAGLVDGVARDLALVWPLLSAVNRMFRSEDDVIIDFSMRRAREHAWAGAVALSVLSGAQRARAVAQLDATATALAHEVVAARPPADVIAFLIRLGERGSVAEIIDDLLRP